MAVVFVMKNITAIFLEVVVIKINEVIVVEGIKDEIAVKRAVDAEVIYVSGFGITKKILKLIQSAQERCGVILLMDSDYAGERIREGISSKIEGVKHAYIPRCKSNKNGNIGVENAKPEDILESIKNAKCMLVDRREEFSLDDLVLNDLVGTGNASIRREFVGDMLGIGYSNGRKFLSRLNSFNISRMEFEEAIKKLR